MHKREVDAFPIDLRYEFTPDELNFIVNYDIKYRMGGSSGSAYRFHVTTGQQLHKLTASDASGGDEFGLAGRAHLYNLPGALSGTLAIVDRQ